MHVTLVHMRVKPEHVEAFIKACRLNHEASIREPGNLRFDFLQDPEDPTRFIFYEPYRSGHDAALHKQTIGVTAKLLTPDKNVLVVAGDGGLMMSAQELETAVRYNIPVVVLILNDNSFGFIKWKQMSRGFATFGVDYANPDFVRFAESFGAAGMRVTSSDSLPDMLEHAFRLGKTVVIECPVDYSVNYETFSSELENLVCEI